VGCDDGWEDEGWLGVTGESMDERKGVDIERSHVERRGSGGRGREY
jgi:hypothetical protein